MAVRCKVICDGFNGSDVIFRTVYEPQAPTDSENQRFTMATPWGEMRLGIDNPKAKAQFEIGRSYYVDFTPAPS